MLQKCCFILLMISSCLLSQTAIQMQGRALEVLSSETESLGGTLHKPAFSPYPSQVFAFVRSDEPADENRYLYIYDLAAKSLTEVRTVLRNSGPTVSAEDTFYQAIVYNEHLHWRPKLDSQDRQWFAFVSNGTENNRDIYIGFSGGSNYIRLTSDPAVDTEPKWSPDGNAIAFISKRSGNGDLYLISDIDKIIADVSRDVENIKLTQLTDTPLEERTHVWNPDSSVNLLAYVKLESFTGRRVATYQIRVMDLAKEGPDNIYNLTNDPLANFYRPSWDPHSGAKVLYVGEGILQNETANLYVSELEWGADRKLVNSVLEGYRTEVFENVRTNQSTARWLAGGEAVLCQENDPAGNYPLYSVNIKRWLDKQERAVNYAESIHLLFPDIRDFDVRKNNLIFVTREVNTSKIYLAQVYGDDILPYKLPAYSLDNKDGKPRVLPEDQPEPKFAKRKTNDGGGIGTRYIVAGGAVAAGVLGYFLFFDDGETGTIQSVPIGLPPSVPGGDGN